MSWFDGIGSAITDGLFDVGMGFFNDYRSRKSAQKAYGRQLEFSNSAHQREVQDLIAAGLNPVLSAGGSGAGGISVSSAGNPNMHRSSSYGQTWNSAKLIQNQNKLLEAQQAQAKSAANVNEANAKLTSAKTVAQQAENVLETAKSEVFQNLPEGAQYDVMNSLLFPSSVGGQVRALASSFLDAIGETWKDTAEYTKARWFGAKSDKEDEEKMKGKDSKPYTFVNPAEGKVIYPGDGTVIYPGENSGHNSAKEVERSEKKRRKYRVFLSW